MYTKKPGRAPHCTGGYTRISLAVYIYYIYIFNVGQNLMTHVIGMISIYITILTITSHLDKRGM